MNIDHITDEEIAIIIRENARLQGQLARARHEGNSATLTLREWITVLNKHGWVCAFCGGSFEVMEHLNPVRSGGGTTPDNCVPSCNPCNVRKGKRVALRDSETGTLTVGAVPVVVPPTIAPSMPTTSPMAIRPKKVVSFLTPQEAAHLTNTTPDAIISQCENHELAAIKMGSQWRILQSGLVA